MTVDDSTSIGFYEEKHRNYIFSFLQAFILLFNRKNISIKYKILLFHLKKDFRFYIKKISNLEIKFKSLTIKQ